MLEAKIDEGILSVKRGGGFMPQVCPYSSSNLDCGDWCPHFGEPEDHRVGYSKPLGASKTLTICNDKQFKIKD